MKYTTIIAVIAAVFSSGCMFVRESYAPGEGTKYQIESSCVGLNWEECETRAQDLCTNVGGKVVSIDKLGGPNRDTRIAIVPKKIKIQCE